VDRLNEKVAKMQEEIGMCAAQLAAQMDETKAAKEAVMEARMEIEVSRFACSLSSSVSGHRL